jgi:hypothetical protein
VETRTCLHNPAVHSGEKNLFFGPKYENGDRKSRTNRELEDVGKGENIVKWIKGQTISWLGHLERMEEDSVPKKFSPKN